ncbi:TetR/AcrR family transcriptional regulator [Saccharopolyspora taberi]|uniref:TetR/AcrR family transcriptional regulator n=1 Tax=Saccharopolyspora taberi TaxID=60895 RepID=UPI0031DF5BB3
MVLVSPGLRERKKQQTREALSLAAIRLTVERGLDNVRVEEIAEAAGVSPRTFNNYFASKAEAISARHLDRMRHANEQLRTRSADEPLWEAISQVLIAQYAGGDPSPEWLSGVRVLTAEPALQGEFMRADAVAEAEFAEVIAERTGTDVTTDMYPSLVSASVGAVVRVVLQRWMSADPPGPLEPLLRDGLAQLAAGLPTP